MKDLILFNELTPKQTEKFFFKKMKKKTSGIIQHL